MHASREAKVAFIQSGWHAEIISHARESFLAELKRRSASSVGVDIYDVAGAFEIPLRAKLLARTGDYAAIVACGLIIDGGIYRHEFVASAVINALMVVQMETEVPVISAVLTPQQFHEHAVHNEFFAQHFVTKGREAAAACLDTIAGITALTRLAKSA